MRKVYLAIAAFFFASISFAQTLYDFESATATGTNISNGWSIAPATGYAWNLNTGGTTSGGTGPTIDHTLGTALGQYIYVEASGTHVTGVTTATLTSPSLNVTTFANAGISFWYHMFGGGMGTLYIEVDAGSGWSTLDSIVGQQQTADVDPWRFATVGLGNVTGNINVRFRKVYGSSFAGDAALDDIQLVEMPPYDIELGDVIASQNYAMIPQQQFQNKQFDFVVQNAGADTVNGVLVNTSETSTPFTANSNTLTQLLPGAFDTVSLTTTFNNSATGVYDFQSIASISQSDTVPINDSAFYSFEVTDSIFARERGNFDGGIGFTGGTGLFGQTFEIVTQDTLTSMSVFLETPTQGDSIRFYIYNFANGLPTTIVDSSDLFIIPSASPAQYQVAFPCDVTLAPGEYFFAVNQIGTNNLGFAYSSEYYTPNKLFYQAPGIAWTPFEAAGFEVSLAIRLVFGNPSGGVFTYDLGPDTSFCPTGGVALTLDATQLSATYLWSTGATTPTIQVSDTGVFTVSVTKCGVSSSDTVLVSHDPVPDVNLGNDTSYCEANGFNYTITLNGTPNASYIWTGGDTTNTKTITSPGFYLVVGDLNGCIARDTIEITEVASLTPISLGPDVEYCSDSSISINLNVSNVPNAIYNWNDGQTMPTRTVTGPGTYIVTVSQTGVCNETLIDTLVVDEQASPMIALTDTFYCSGGSVLLEPGSGYDSYVWSTGDNSETLNVTTSGNYSVTVSTSAGCESVASSLVSIRPGITVDLGNDVNFWQPVTLDAGPGFESYLWSTGDTSQTTVASSTGTYWVLVGSDQGCFASDTVEVTLNLGLSSLTGGDVTMYPNPTSGTIFLDYPGNTEELNVKIFSMDGKEIFNQKMVVGGNASAQIDLNGNTPGIYIIRLEKDGESVMKRFVLR